MRQDRRMGLIPTTSRTNKKDPDYSTPPNRAAVASSSTRR
jgi:hypothetical protein